MFINGMSYDPMLDAVNACLSGIGQAKIDTVDDGNLDADMAVNVINRVSRQMQARGWWFNTEANWNITPNPENGQILQPVNALALKLVERLRYHQFAIRKGYIYDVDNHTYDLRPLVDKEGKIGFTFIMYLDYEDCPPVFQTAVTETAKRVFAQDLEVDANRWQFQSKDENRAIAMLEREQGRNSRRNYLRDSPVIRNAYSHEFWPR